MAHYSTFKNTSIPQVGSVAYIHFSEFESKKRQKTDGRHPFVITAIENGFATVVGLSSSGDIFAEKNAFHFIPPEACALLNSPSFPIPHRATFTIELNRFPQRFAQLSDSALAIVEEYVEYYEANSSEFVPFSGATYPVVRTRRIDATAADVYYELDLPVLTYEQAKKKSDVKKLKRRQYA